MTSCSASGGRSAAAGEGTKAQRVLPASVLRAATSLLTASSRLRPNCTEFSISSSDTTSALIALIDLTILLRWRRRFVSSQAPRGPLGLQEFTAIGLSSRSRNAEHVLVVGLRATNSAAETGKKFSTLKVASLMSPPTAAAPAGRVFSMSTPTLVPSSVTCSTGIRRRVPKLSL